MKHLVIIGAGGFGRELCLAARHSLGYGTEFDIKGFLDLNVSALDGFEGYPAVLGTPDGYEIEEDDVFISALGNVQLRRRNVELVGGRGGKFISLIHSSASVGENVSIGAGCYIAHNAVLTADVVIEDHVCVFHGTVVGHDCRIEAFSHVSSQVFLGGGVWIGEGVVIQPGTKVSPKKKIHDGAEIGIGSVVLSNVKAGAKVFGVPAIPLEF